MKEPAEMKLLIAYDGSSCSEAALDDLIRAGFDDSCTAVIISVAEVWLPPPNGNDNVTGFKLDEVSERMIQKHYEKNKRIVAEAATLANHAKKRLLAMFPRWQVSAEATYGSPAWAILERADKLETDLIVVGSHGRSAISRLFLGSVSQKVLTEARCSVRVARGRVEVDPAPVRIVIGFDGSNGAQTAARAVATRAWPRGSEVRLIAATEEVNPSAVGRFLPPVTSVVAEINACEREWIENRAESALTELRSKNIAASLHVHAGNPKTVLVEEAGSWNADSIFVGANSFGSVVERFLLGSTSAAVATRAHCSVEAVRTHDTA